MNIKNRNSVILITILLFATIATIGFVYWNKANSTKVLITIDGQRYGKYSLNKNQIINISNNGDVNVVEIKDQQVSVISANCDNQVCVNTYPISKDFPSLIVCLPHGVIIELID